MPIQTPSLAPQPDRPPNEEVSGLLESLEKLKTDAEALRANYTDEAAALADRLCSYGHRGSHGTPEDIDQLARQYVKLMASNIDFDCFANSLYRAGGFANNLTKLPRLWLDDRLAPWNNAISDAFQSEERKIQLTSLQLDLRWCQLLQGSGLSREDGKIHADRKALTDHNSEQRIKLMDMFTAWCSDQIDVVRRLHTLANTHPVNE